MDKYKAKHSVHCCLSQKCFKFDSIPPKILRKGAYKVKIHVSPLHSLFMEAFSLARDC